MTVTNTAIPEITGNARQGQTLHTTNGEWTYDLDFLTFAYQWLRCDSAGANCVPIAGANSASYFIVAADIGSRLRSEVSATESAYPAPPPGDVLLWKSPSALGILGVGAPLVEFTLTDATRNSSALTCSPIGSKDIRITQTQKVTSGPMNQISGWRNIEWIKGEFELNTTSSGSGCVPIRNCTGIAHIEGVWLHGSQMIDCLVLRSAEATEGFIVQVENCRFEAHDSPTEHADCIQFQNVKLDGFRYDKNTFWSELQGTFMRVGTSANDYAVNGFLSRINYRGTGDNAFWQAWENNDTTPVFKRIVPIDLDDVWVAEDGDTRSVGMRVLPRSDFTASPQAGGPRRGNFPAVDGTGPYTRFSTTSDTVPVGSAAGQSCLDCQITGIIRKGIPPDGDFVPAGFAGMTYVSPGYA